MRVKEPSIIIKPIGRFGGLDNLHITFAIVIALLFLLLLVVSYSRPILIRNTSAANCTYGYFNGSCAKPLHNETQVKLMVERILASYADVNSSLSVLPYISDVESTNTTYLPQSGEWYISLIAKNPMGNLTFLISFLMKDSNLSAVTPLIQTAKPSSLSNNYVVSQGVVKLGGKFACDSQSPLIIYWFIDPYAPGSVRNLLNATNLESRFGSAVNVSIKIIYGPSTLSIASTYGLENAQFLGKYIFCASKQPNFKDFVSNLNSLYSDYYLPQSALANLASSSNINSTELSSCLASSTQTINAQALLAKYYNITQTPSVIVNCEYMSLPQTAYQAICYANKTLC